MRAYLRKAKAGSPSNQAQQTSAKPRRKRRLSPDGGGRARLQDSSPPPIPLDAPPSLAPDAAQPTLPGLDGLLPPAYFRAGEHPTLTFSLTSTSDINRVAIAVRSFEDRQ